MLLPPSAFDLRAACAAHISEERTRRAVEQVKGAYHQPASRPGDGIYRGRAQRRIELRAATETQSRESRMQSGNSHKDSSRHKAAPRPVDTGSHPAPLASHPVPSSQKSPSDKLPAPSARAPTLCTVREEVTPNSETTAEFKLGSNPSLSVTTTKLSRRRKQAQGSGDQTRSRTLKLKREKVEKLPLLPTFVATSRCLPSVPAFPGPPPLRKSKRSAAVIRAKAMMDMDRIMIGLRTIFHSKPLSEAESLLTLPFEIREMIYRFVVTADEKLGICKCIWSNYHTQPPITQVCRQTRREALPIFYTMNTFAFSFSHADQQVLSAWLSIIGYDNRKSLRRLEIDTYDAESVVADLDLFDLELVHTTSESEYDPKKAHGDQLFWYTFRGIKPKIRTKSSAETDRDNESMETTDSSILWRRDVWDSRDTLVTGLPCLVETHESRRFSSKHIVESMIRRSNI